MVFKKKYRNIGPKKHRDIVNRITKFQFRYTDTVSKMEKVFIE
jgi:hypothetical protein